MGICKNVVDSHIHLDHWFDPNGKDYIECLDRVQAQTGIEALAIACLGNKLIGGPDINTMAAIYKLHNPTAYAYGALVFPEYPAKAVFPEGMDPLSQYRTLMAMGFDGIKFLYGPDIMQTVGIPINDPVFEPMFAQMEADGTPILWHVADPPADWYGNEYRQKRYDETLPTFEQLLAQTLDVLKRHPKLHITFAHFLFLEEQPERLEEIFASYENVWVDLTPGTMFWEFDKRRAYFKAFLEKYADRLVYGSDAFVPGNPNSVPLIQNVYRWIATEERANVWGLEIDGFALSEQACRKILRENYLRRNASPKKIDEHLLRDYWKRFGAFTYNEENKKQIDIWMA